MSQVRILAGRPKFYFKVKKEEKRLNIVKKHGKLLTGIFLGFVVLFIISYGSFAFAYRDKSLPYLKYENIDLGNKTKGEIIFALKDLFFSRCNNPVEIEFESVKVKKSYNELGINIDYARTEEKIRDFGKFFGILPSPAYIVATISKKVEVYPTVTWVKDEVKITLELFPEKKEDAKNPTLKSENGEVKVESESEGYRLNPIALRASVEKCFVSNCTKINAERVSLRSNITAKDLDPYLDEIKKYAAQDIKITSGYRSFTLVKQQILDFVDVERTVLENKVVLSDEKINQYLDTISAKVDRKGATRKISGYDGTVISEGNEGVKLDRVKAKETIKDALQNNKIKISLVVTTGEIKEEIVQPAFTPGKYPGKYIEINLSEQNLYQWEGTNLINTFKVSTGKWSMPTPTGEFSVNNKDPRAYSREYGLYMPWWMSFIGSQYGIHELPEWPNGTKEGEGHLGTPVSHGCIRLGRGSAQTIYDWVEIGTPVYTHR